jgi:hypothetical protein
MRVRKIDLCGRVEPIECEISDLDEAETVLEIMDEVEGDTLFIGEFQYDLL